MGVVGTSPSLDCHLSCITHNCNVVLGIIYGQRSKDLSPGQLTELIVCISLTSGNSQNPATPDTNGQWGRSQAGHWADGWANGRVGLGSVARLHQTKIEQQFRRRFAVFHIVYALWSWHCHQMVKLNVFFNIQYPLKEVESGHDADEPAARHVRYTLQMTDTDKFDKVLNPWLTNDKFDAGQFISLIDNYR